MEAANSASDGGMVGYRIPMARPRWTFILLGVNIAVFLAMTVFGALNGLGLNGSQDSRVLLTFGAMQNRFEAVIGNLQIAMENQTAARSRITDADFAAETAALTRAQILQQAGTAMVAQANQLPQQVLSLLR